MNSWNATLSWIVGVSGVMFVASIALAVGMIAMMPPDYLTRDESPEAVLLNNRPMLRAALWLLKNMVGILLLVAGVVMLLTPGQGLLFIFLGLTLVDFPGKNRLLRQVIQRPNVLKSINRIRQHCGRSPLETMSQSPNETAAY